MVSYNKGYPHWVGPITCAETALQIAGHMLSCQAGSIANLWIDLDYTKRFGAGLQPSTFPMAGGLAAGSNFRALAVGNPSQASSQGASLQFYGQPALYGQASHVDSRRPAPGRPRRVSSLSWASLTLLHS